MSSDDIDKFRQYAFAFGKHEEGALNINTVGTNIIEKSFLHIKDLLQVQILSI